MSAANALIDSNRESRLRGSAATTSDALTGSASVPYMIPSGAAASPDRLYATTTSGRSDRCTCRYAVRRTAAPACAASAAITRR